MDIRIPHFDGQKDFLAFLRFLDNRKVFEGYIKQLDTKIAAFVKASAVYGKAKDIEKKHEEAELWARRAEHDYAEREEKLVAGLKAWALTRKEERAKLNDREAEIEMEWRKAKNSLAVRDEALKALEADVVKREETIGAREKRTEKAQKAAVEAKHVANQMVARMKAAMPNG